MMKTLGNIRLHDKCEIQSTCSTFKFKVCVMAYKYNPIGSTFKEGDVTLLVVESKDGGSTCKGCFYSSYIDRTKRAYNGSCFTHGHACTTHLRKDRKQVIFKKVST